MSRIRGRIAALALTGSSAVVLGTGSGCVTAEESRGDSTVLLDGGSSGRPGGASTPGARAARGAGVRNADGTVKPLPGFEDHRGPLGRSVPVFTATVRAEVQQRGAVAFDEQTLPLVSPAGDRMAVSTGFAPTWDAMLAEPDAGAVETGVAIYAVPPGTNAPPRLLARVMEPVILGRAVDDRGFLVESIRPDRSRWIGLADWESGAIDWLVTAGPEIQNAFATLGPDGWMAWSRRRPGQAGFSLVIRNGRTGVETEIPARTASWLMPRFALDGTAGLFAFALEGDALSIVHLDASAGEAPNILGTMRRTRIATDLANASTAYQAMATDVAMISPDAIPAPAGGRLYFTHPSRYRAAVWRPDRPLPDLFDAGTISAVPTPDDANYCLVTGSENLVRRAVDERRDRIRVIAGVHVARATTNPDRPFVLLQPQGSILGVTLLRFEPVGDVLGE